MLGRGAGLAFAAGSAALKGNMTHLVHSELGISSVNVVFLCVMLAVLYIVGSFTTIILFQRYSREKYGYKFFGVRKCYQAAWGLLSLIMACVISHDALVGRPTGELGPVPALIIGSLLLGALAVENIRKTDLKTGLFGAVLQTITAPVLALGGILFLTAIIGLFAAVGPVVPVIDIGGLGEGVVAKVRRK